MSILHVGEFPDQEIFAIYTEAPGGGSVDDINSLRNRPALDPEAWFANVFFHSDLDNMEVLAESSTITINHAATSAGGTSSSETSMNQQFDLDPTTVDHELYTHNLGILPYALVSLGGAFLSPGYIVQVGANTGAARYVCPFVTTTKVFLREYRSRGTAGLSAISLNYKVLVFAEPPAPSGDKLREFDSVTGDLKLARNRFDSSRRYLQVVAGGSPFGLAIGRTMQGRNGSPRFIAADGTPYDPVSSLLKTGMVATGGTFSTDTVVYGAALGYNGTFTTDNYIDVQAP